MVLKQSVSVSFYAVCVEDARFEYLKMRKNSMAEGVGWTATGSRTKNVPCTETLTFPPNVGTDSPRATLPLFQRTRTYEYCCAAVGVGHLFASNPEPKLVDTAVCVDIQAVYSATGESLRPCHLLTCSLRFSAFSLI